MINFIEMQAILIIISHVFSDLETIQY